MKKEGIELIQVAFKDALHFVKQARLVFYHPHSQLNPYVIWDPVKNLSIINM